MGRAARWLKGLFGIRKPKDSGDQKDSNNTSCVGRSRRNPPVNSIYNTQSGEEQNRHAIAVASATAAAADAAVAAAQAAVTVIKLTSQGVLADGAGRGTETLAAVKIQSQFRGYLARKELRALKGLVKLQSLVRGYMVRKQAAATLRIMEAMVRAEIWRCVG